MSDPTTANPTPSIGRIVLYKHPDTGETYPAIVTVTRDDGAISLTIFRPGRVEWRWAVEGTEHGQWQWPVIK